MPRERCDPWKLISRKDAKTQIIDKCGGRSETIGSQNLGGNLSRVISCPLLFGNIPCSHASGELRPLEVNFTQRRKDANN